MNNYIEIVIGRWSEFNGRKDITHPSWFRMEYRMVEDTDFYDFTHEEFRAWIYLLSQACRKAKGAVRVNFDHAERCCRISKKAMISAIQKLEELQHVVVKRNVDVTPTLRERDVDDTRTIRDRQTDRQTDRVVNSADALTPLAEIWNQEKGRLRGVKDCKDRKRKAQSKILWEQNPTKEYWIKILQKVQASDFLSGRKPSASNPNWRANFDWLIRPGTVTKIEEGQYDNPGSANARRLQTIEELALEEIRAQGGLVQSVSA